MTILLEPCALHVSSILILENYVGKQKSDLFVSLSHFQRAPSRVAVRFFPSPTLTSNNMLRHSTHCTNGMYRIAVRSRVLPRLKTPRSFSSLSFYLSFSLSLSSFGFYEGFKLRPGQTRNEGHVDGWRTRASSSTMLSPLFHSILLRETYLFPDKYFPFEFQVCCSHSLEYERPPS